MRGYMFEHWSEDSTLPDNSRGGVERSDVAKPDNNLVSLREHVPPSPVGFKGFERAHGPISPTSAPDSIIARVRERKVKVFRPLSVRGREYALAETSDMRHEIDREAGGPQSLHTIIKVFAGYMSRGCDHGDMAAGLQKTLRHGDDEYSSCEL